ncbi:MAG: 50S ribosomal protein L32 [Calditrichaeota bacterium]|nr:50S ribosomal protein L32 [Calditrichota bacterium]MBT7617078.1 50S ribosomal protein L32 [Calditrichota bacterium]MBT7790683.1 50S ribosomal protein L32 [Calditrichota bacterium]
MPVPKRRISKSKILMRRSHHRLTKPTIMECPNCHDIKQPHTVCPECGFYKGRQVIAPRES